MAAAEPIQMGDMERLSQLQALINDPEFENLASGLRHVGRSNRLQTLCLNANFEVAGELPQRHQIINATLEEILPKEGVEIIIIAVQTIRRYHEGEHPDRVLVCENPSTTYKPQIGIATEDGKVYSCDGCPRAEFGPENSAPKCREMYRVLAVNAKSLAPYVFYCHGLSYKPLTNFLDRYIWGALPPTDEEVDAADKAGSEALPKDAPFSAYRIQLTAHPKKVKQGTFGVFKFTVVGVNKSNLFSKLAKLAAQHERNFEQSVTTRTNRALAAVGGEILSLGAGSSDDVVDAEVDVTAAQLVQSTQGSRAAKAVRATAK